jgi:peptidyl-tRNA hydrolase, PTH1 family
MNETGAIRLIAGLGNAGPRYQQTRHNTGFWFVDALMRAHNGHFHVEPKFDGEAGRIGIASSNVWLFKPGAFMNRSGRPLRSICAFYKIPLSDVLVVHDEVDLPPGVVRLKRGGGHGGHNGVREIFTHLGQNFWRLRLGVGHPGHKDKVVDYVLSAPHMEERQVILDGMDKALAVVPRLIKGDFERAMHQLHTAK